MDVRSCRACGKLFNYMDNGVKICPSCAEVRERKFQEVKEYIREHKTATLQQISEDMDVSIKQLQQWVREERLKFADDSPIAMECENCGAPIKTGRFCPACKGKVADGLSDGLSKPEPAPQKSFRDNSNRMRSI